MRGASGEMRESRAKALRRKEGESSRYHPWQFAEEHKKTRCDARRTSTPGSCPSLCALAPWRLGALARDQFFLLCGSAGAYSFLCVRAKKSPRKGGVPGGQRTPTFSGSDWTPQSRCRALREADARVHSSLRPSLRRSNTASGIPLEQCRAAPPALIHWAAKRTVSILAFGWRLVRPDPAVPAGRAGRHRVYVDQPAFLLEPAWR